MMEDSIPGQAAKVDEASDHTEAVRSKNGSMHLNIDDVSWSQSLRHILTSEVWLNILISLIDAPSI